MSISPTPEPANGLRPTTTSQVPRPASKTGTSGLRPVAPPLPSSLPSARKKMSSDARLREGFAAQIEGASLADLVQMECMRGLTRAVRVAAEEGDGILYFDQGQVVHASVLDDDGAVVESGEAAALTLLRWRSGTAQPAETRWLDPPTIRSSWQGLLMSAAQAEDEDQRDSEIPVDVELVDVDGVVDDVGAFAEEIDAVEDAGAGLEASQAVEGDAVSDSDTEKSGGEELDPGVIRAVRLDAEGAVLGSVGDVREFGDMAAYVVRLAQLIGDGLGLEDFQGLECQAQERTMVTYVEQGTVVALEAHAKCDVGKYRKRAGT